MILIISGHVANAADEIFLTSGDHLIGSIKQVDRQHIIIETSFSEQLKIKHALVSEVVMQKPIDIVFADGTVTNTILKKYESSQLSYKNGNETVVIDINELADNPQELASNQQSVTPKIKSSGSLDVGLSRSSGNEDDEDYHGALMAQARTLKNRYTLEASKTIEKNDGDKTQDETFGSFQLDHFINKKWYALASASFEEDLEELLNLRSTYSLGSGYQFFDEDELTLKAEMGLAYVDEDFDEDEDNHYAGGRWAIDYEQLWLKWLGIFHRHEGFFSLENSDDMNIRSSTGFKFPFNANINARLQANIDWNRSPAEGATGTDKEYLFTLGYEF